MKSKLLVPMLALVLAACGGGGDETAPAPAPIPADAINPDIYRTMSAADDQFCFHHLGVSSQRGVANLDADPHIIQTTFPEEVICNDGFGAIRTFVILTGELVS